MYEVTHRHNAGRVEVTEYATAINWDYTAEPPVVRLTVPRVGDGAPLSAVIPMARVVRVSALGGSHRADDANH